MIEAELEAAFVEIAVPRARLDTAEGKTTESDWDVWNARSAAGRARGRGRADAVACSRGGGAGGGWRPACCPAWRNTAATSSRASGYRAKTRSSSARSRMKSGDSRTLVI